MKGFFSLEMIKCMVVLNLKTVDLKAIQVLKTKLNINKTKTIFWFINNMDNIIFSLSIISSKCIFESRKRDSQISLNASMFVTIN